MRDNGGMPRIDAPTVAAHHAMRHDAIVAAARETLVAEGVSAVTPAAVAAQAGLARTSVYQYYPSTGALVAAAVEAIFAEANAVLSGVVGRVGDPRERIHRYIAAALELAARNHGPFHPLSIVDLPPMCRARVRELHEELLAPLHAAVEDLGVGDPEIVVGLAFGAISAAAQLVDHGTDLAAATDRTVRFVDAGLDSARASGASAPGRRASTGSTASPIPPTDAAAVG